MTTGPTTADAFSGPSFSVSNRLARLAWNITCKVLFRPSPRPLHGWRSFLLTLFGARLGKGCHIYPRAVIWAPWNLVCGDQVGVADGAILYNQAPITIGNRTVISQGSHLCTGSHDYDHPGFPLFAKPIRVGNQSWIAAECFVHPGVEIGDGTVVGARSVVNKNLPAWTVCAGHPCMPVKQRALQYLPVRPEILPASKNAQISIEARAANI